MNILREIRTLRDEGKLHRRLLMRIRILLGISLVLFGIVLFNLLIREVDWRWVFGLILLGLPLGFFVFSRSSIVQWNEDAEILEAGRMDAIGFTALALSIGYEIALHFFVEHIESTYIVVYVLAGVFGGLYGRALGLLVRIHRAYQAAHPAAEPTLRFLRE